MEFEYLGGRHTLNTDTNKGYEEDIEIGKRIAAFAKELSKEFGIEVRTTHTPSFKTKIDDYYGE